MDGIWIVGYQVREKHDSQVRYLTPACVLYLLGHSVPPAFSVTSSRSLRMAVAVKCLLFIAFLLTVLSIPLNFHVWDVEVSGFEDGQQA